MSNLYRVIDNEKERLDKYLSNIQEDFSRSKIQAMIKEGLILVNGEGVSSNYKVKLDDEIEVLDLKKEVEDIEAEDIPLDILYEDDSLVVINKPKGMVVHPGAGNFSHTLVNALLFHFNNLSNSKDAIRPGIVHRIDKNTTGCLIVCKDDKAHEIIADQLKNKTCKRTYIALVEGIIDHETGTIDAPIARSNKNRQKMMVTDVNAKNAVTHFKVLKRFMKTTLIECELETGRTHQIRVHMNYINHPVVGDDKYGYSSTRKDTCGQMLHAKKIEFIHPVTKKHMVIEADLPEYFKNILEDLAHE